MTALLASVTDPEEALLAAQAGVDLIDLKNPREGALGALPARHIQNIAKAIEGHCLSATIGDLPLHPEEISAAVQATGELGVDYVKIGLFPGGDLEEVLTALKPLTKRFSLVAVLFADYLIALPLIETLAETGFKGVMLDTAHKEKGSLTHIRHLDFLRRFITLAQHHGLLTGLAGSLKLEDIPRLLPLAPDYLGFRGALCQTGERTQRLEPQRLAKIRAAIPFPPRKSVSSTLAN